MRPFGAAWKAARRLGSRVVVLGGREGVRHLDDAIGIGLKGLWDPWV